MRVCDPRSYRMSGTSFCVSRPSQPKDTSVLWMRLDCPLVTALADQAQTESTIAPVRVLLDSRRLTKGSEQHLTKLARLIRRNSNLWNGNLAASTFLPCLSNSTI